MCELKPCPFCGGRASVRHHGDMIESYLVYCMNEDCKVEPQTHTYLRKEDAIEAWNRRCSDG